MASPKWYVAIPLVLFGVMGLLMTACGILFLPSASLLALVIGVVPGSLVIWLTVLAWRKAAPREPMADTQSPLAFATAASDPGAAETVHPDAESSPEGDSKSAGAHRSEGDARPGGTSGPAR